MPLELFLLLLGLVGLWFGTDLALDGAIDVCKRLGLSEGFVGLTLLAIGTGLPELVVGIDGGIQQLQGIEASGVVVGNAVGSAISQGGLVLGIAGIMSFLTVSPNMIRRDGVALLMAVLLLAMLGLDGRITRAEGGVLFLAYAAYFVVLLRSEEVPLASIDGDALQKVWRTVLGVGGGLGLVVFSAQLVVTQAVLLASNWEVSQTLIGIFLVGIGTSLPELALSVRAALRGQASLSVGNVIGSNTFDLLVPVGASALIHPLAVEQNAVRFDLPAMAVITICTMVFFLSRKGLPKWAAATLLVLYGTYLGLRVWVV